MLEEFTESEVQKAKCKATHMYGLAADPKLTKWENAKKHLSNTMIQQYLCKISIKTTHNLCTYKQPPKNVEKLLGLGLNFCIQKRHPIRNFEKLFERMRYNIRTKYFFQDQEAGEYEKKIYLKSPDWIPPFASYEIE